jgi:hypothetical protein
MLGAVMLGAVMMLAGCGTARLIHRDQVGGVIELQGDRGKAMEQANEEMAVHCGPDNFTIVDEGEEAIGTDTVTRKDQTTDSKTPGTRRRPATDSTTTAQQSTPTATAWRVHYQCGIAAVGTDGPPPPRPPSNN